MRVAYRNTLERVLKENKPGVRVLPSRTAIAGGSRGSRR